MLHLGGRDVLAAADHDVFQAVDDGEVAVGVGREVAGAEPAVGRERRVVERGVEVAGAHLGAARPELSRLPVGDVGECRRVDDAQLRGADQPAVGARLHLGIVAEPAGGEGRVLGRAVGAFAPATDARPTEARRAFAHRRRCDARAAERE